MANGLQSYEEAVTLRDKLMAEWSKSVIIITPDYIEAHGLLWPRDSIPKGWPSHKSFFIKNRSDIVRDPRYTNADITGLPINEEMYQRWLKQTYEPWLAQREGTP